MARATRATRATKTARSARKGKSNNDGESYITKRAAGYLHDGVDRIASRGERIEQRLHDGASRIDDEAHRFLYGVRGGVNHHPWVAVGGSVALGFIVGLLSARGADHNHEDDYYHYRRR
jgi:ElaB/YqjD/DUF883 family membrane-anchored ribosome-binding protein